MPGLLNVGFFGKLPSAGDFVQRRLPASFVDVWDRSFEHAVADSRRALGEDWNNAYRSSPIWRLVMSAGVCGPSGWAGVMGPGVDRVGRCFPLLIACDLGPDATAPAKALALGHWFDAAERVLAGALSAQPPPIEQFDGQVAALAHSFGHPPNDFLLLREVDLLAQRHWRLPLPAAGTLSAGYLQMAWQRMAGTVNGCLWWTRGNGRIPATVLMTAGLPQPQAFAGFLDAAQAGQPWQTLGDFPASVPRAPVAAASPPAVAAPGPVAGPVVDVFAVIPAIISDDLSDLFPDAPPLPVAAPEPQPAELDADLTVPMLRGVSPPSEPVPAFGTMAMPSAPPCARLQSSDGSLTLIASDSGGRDPEQRAAMAVSAALSDFPPSGPGADLAPLRQRLLALHERLRVAAEDLIDPVISDCSVVAASLAGGHAALLTIGAAQVWRWRDGLLQPLKPVPALAGIAPNGDAGDALDDLLFSSQTEIPAGLGALREPDCAIFGCELQSGDRLLLTATARLGSLPTPLLAHSLALPSTLDAQAQIASHAGLPSDISAWPFAVIDSQ